MLPVLIITLFFSFLLSTAPNEVAAADEPIFLTGSKTFEITEYSYLDQYLKTGERIRSDPFTVGGYQWVIDVYPNGTRPEYSEYVAIMVRVINTTDTVSARSIQRLMDWTTSKWSTTTPVFADLETYPPPGRWGYDKFMKQADFKVSNYLKDGAFLIKVTMWVVVKPPAMAAGAFRGGNKSGQWNNVISAADDNSNVKSN